MAVPERIGKYAISEILGQGAMGVVYKGFDPHIHRTVAIKTIHKTLLGNAGEHESIAARFRNEAQAVGRIAHPGVVAIYEFGEDEQTAYIAMEFVEGRNLDHVLAGTPLLEEAQILRIMDQLLDALSAAHAQGVLHRDVKPANLILTSSGQIKLTDFGIARIEHAGLTQVSSMIGTPGYMAPEQYVGEGIDQRTDLFACGVLLYRLLTGEPAFSGQSEVVMYKILNEHPVVPSKRTEGRRSAAFDAVVTRAIAKNSDDRYPTAQAMRTALAAVAMALTAGPGQTVNSDATVIVAPAQWARTFEAIPASASPQVAGSQRSAISGAPPTGWDQQDLSRIERVLATHIGPMAKLMVREAARTCSDLPSLAAAVSRHIAEEGKRQHFLDAATRTVAGSQARTVLGAAPATSSPSGSSTAMSEAVGTLPVSLSEEFKSKAMQVLTRQMGPIARVVVKRAADQSGGQQARFVQILLDGASEADRPVLRRELG